MKLNSHSVTRSREESSIAPGSMVGPPRAGRGDRDNTIDLNEPRIAAAVAQSRRQQRQQPRHNTSSGRRPRNSRTDSTDAAEILQRAGRSRRLQAEPGTINHDSRNARAYRRRGQGPLACPVQGCERRFYYEQSRVRHIQDVHDNRRGRPLYSCRLCGYQTPELHNMRRHQLTQGHRRRLQDAVRGLPELEELDSDNSSRAPSPGTASCCSESPSTAASASLCASPSSVRSACGFKQLSSAATSTYCVRKPAVTKPACSLSSMSAPPLNHAVMSSSLPYKCVPSMLPPMNTAATATFVPQPAQTYIDQGYMSAHAFEAPLPVHFLAMPAAASPADHVPQPYPTVMYLQFNQLEAAQAHAQAAFRLTSQQQ